MQASLTPAATLAEEFGISRHAVDLAREVDFLDLHLDGFIPARLFGYDLRRCHTKPPGGGRRFGHLDFPRALDAGLSGAMWSITTNPWRGPRSRWRTLLRNLERFGRLVAGTGGALRVVSTHTGYVAARGAGAHAVLVTIQGGNALHAERGYAHALPEDTVTAVTLLHLTHSFLGRSSTPLPTRRAGLTAAGEELIRSLNERRIFVDLAHIHPEGFRAAVRVHDPSQPLIDTHTGVSGVTPHWRNLEDSQLRAIADSGGVVGIIFEPAFLRRPGGPRDLGMILEHVDHVVRTVGEDFVAIGSDYDGAITPPPPLRDGRALPCLVQGMLDRGYREERVAKILGGNFLRAFALLRP